MRAVTGWLSAPRVRKSYGAFLSAWAISHGPEFRAAMVSAPVADMASHAGTSDSGYYVTPFAMGGSADECRARYDALSPVEYVSNAYGPVLLLNGDQDQRCPLGQAEQLFTRLLRLGCQPATLVIYPGGTRWRRPVGRRTGRITTGGQSISFEVLSTELIAARYTDVLRQKDAPQSKSLAAPHSQAGD